MLVWRARYTPVSLYFHHVHVHPYLGHIPILTDIFHQDPDYDSFTVRTMVSSELPFPSMRIRVCDMVTPSCLFGGMFPIQDVAGKRKLRIAGSVDVL